jgi:hypothetical protein
MKELILSYGLPCRYLLCKNNNGKRSYYKEGDEVVGKISSNLSQ